ncbi:protein rexA [Pantoea brenneri]|uniref:protein rexA n=1 Tax=Pantoea brenneri TaxID=472694 RepID=UPI002897F83F|nr:protein rexA [Pantoea brenneri]
MKLSFNAIYALDKNSGKKTPLDFLRLLSEQVIDAKNHSQQIEDYYVFAHHISGESFLITKTFDSDLVKRINRKTFSVDEIRSSLSSDESLGFPSFLYINGNVIGFAKTLYGPSVRELTAYINARCKIPDGHKLSIEPLMRDITKDDAMNMQFIGRTTIRVESASRLLGPVLRTLGAQSIDEELLEGIEITIKPKRMRNIKGFAKEIIDNIDEQHESILLKGKEEAADLLTEFYLSNKGQISANLYRSTNEDLALEMATCYIRMKPIIVECFANMFGDELTI